GDACYSGGISNSTIIGNVVLSPCTGETDCGAIYLQDWGSTRSTNIAIDGNFVRDAPRGIYLDDGTSNVTVTRNVAAGITDACWNIHAGANNVYQYNLCDMQNPNGHSIARYESSDLASMGTGNAFKNNIIIGNG